MSAKGTNVTKLSPQEMKAAAKYVVSMRDRKDMLFVYERPESTWAVRKSGNTRVSKIFKTKGEAYNYALSLGSDYEIYVMDVNGNIIKTRKRI